MNIILRKNATSLYRFLSFINDDIKGKEPLESNHILDCAAGGMLPPLALFASHGMKATGIDISQTQIDSAQKYATKHNLDINFECAKMQSLPFEDETFDYVYEHYSMCHINGDDVSKSISEMHRVLKKGGLCFLGVISNDTWPKTLLGEEVKPGEYAAIEGEENVIHYTFSDKDAKKFVEGWQILSAEKSVIYLNELAEKTSQEEWNALYDTKSGYSKDKWISMYSDREHFYKYVHTYFYLKKK